MSDAEIYNQRDPRWAALRYGLPGAGVSSTIGAYGCAITAVAQKLTLMGWPTTPPDVQSALVQAKAFRRGGSNNFVDWDGVPRAFRQLHYNGRMDYPTMAVPGSVLRMIEDRLAKADPVIAYVDASQYTAGLQQHFVLIVGQSETGAFYINNPWNGRRQDFRAYGKTDALAICGLIFLDTVFDASAAT